MAEKPQHESARRVRRTQRKWLALGAGCLIAWLAISFLWPKPDVVCGITWANGELPTRASATLLWRHASGALPDTKQRIEFTRHEKHRICYATTRFPDTPADASSAWQVQVQDVEADGDTAVVVASGWMRMDHTDNEAAGASFTIKPLVPGAGFRDADTIAWLRSHSAQIRRGVAPVWTSAEVARVRRFLRGCVLPDVASVAPPDVAAALLVAADISRHHNLTVDLPVLTEAVALALPKQRREVMRSVAQLLFVDQMQFYSSTNEDPMRDRMTDGWSAADRATLSWLLDRQASTYCEAASNNRTAQHWWDSFDDSLDDSVADVKEALEAHWKDDLSAYELAQTNFHARAPSENEFLLRRARMNGKTWPTEELQFLVDTYAQHVDERQVTVGYVGPDFDESGVVHGFQFELALTLRQQLSAEDRQSMTTRASLQLDCALATAIGPTATLESLRTAAGLESRQTLPELLATYWHSNDPNVLRLVEALALSGDAGCIQAMQSRLSEYREPR